MKKNKQRALVNKSKNESLNDYPIVTSQHLPKVSSPPIQCGMIQGSIDAIVN